MKITTFNPQIITKDADSLVKLFGELGFEKHHNPRGIGELNVEDIRMKDGNGSQPCGTISTGTGKGYMLTWKRNCRRSTRFLRMPPT